MFTHEIYIFLLYLTFVFYISFSTYIFLMNTKSNRNRLFFLITLSMSIWSLGFLFMEVFNDYETALKMKRLSAIGWGTVYSFMLHFVLIMTGKKKILSRRFTYIALYLPALVNVYVFSISPSIAPRQYDLVWNGIRWINLQVQNPMSWYFNVYYISFSILSIILLFNWSRKMKSKKKRNQARIIFSLFVLILLISTITDRIIQNQISRDIPLFGVIMITIPVMVVFYAIKKYEHMKKSETSNEAKLGNILSEKKKIRFYHYIGYYFIIASILNWTHILFAPDELRSVLVFSMKLLFIGILIVVIPLLNISMKHKDNILSVVIAISIPVILINFIGKGVSDSIWAIPLLFLSLSAIFNKKTIFFAVTISTLATHIYIYINDSNVQSILDSSNYFVRTLIYILSITIAYYISNLYIGRLEENEEKTELQRKIANISKSFVTVNSKNIKGKVMDMLDDIGDYYGTERLGIVMFSDSGISKYRYEIDRFEDEKKSRDINYELEIPIESDGKQMGYLKLESIKKKLKLKEYHSEMLNVVANITGDAIMKIEAEKEINYMAYYDNLTGLYNRKMMKEYLEQVICSLQEYSNIGVMLIDIDSFKMVNDTIGHSGGDILLKKIAKKINYSIREDDMLGRIGGDEFLIVFPYINNIDELKNISDRIISVISSPLKILNHEFFITASAGVSLFPQDGLDADTLIKNADLAMYESKNKGKNKWTFCSDILKKNVQEVTELKNDLYRAIENDEFVLYYQPQVCIESEEIIAMEALIRWDHPKRGFISPGIFIPLAEQSEVINSMGKWVIEQVCRQIRIWREEGLAPIRIAINISVKQLYSHNLIEILDESIKKENIDPKYLELEITESVASREKVIFIDAINNLKKLGVSISIDDFGSEYSAFGRLKNLPIDRIKIDKQFIWGISEDDKDEAIIKVIIYLTQMLGVKVIAEGVETKHQLRFLRKYLCDEIQGYYFYKPMPVNKIEDILISKQ